MTIVPGEGQFDPEDQSQNQSPFVPIEDEITRLGSNFTDAPLYTAAQRLDRADEMYRLAYNAGLIEGEPEYPSERRDRVYREQRELARPVVVRSTSGNMRSDESMARIREFTHPRLGLEGSAKPAAVLELINDADHFYPTKTVTWMESDSIEDATAYCSRLGWHHTQPGPGEYDDKDTSWYVLDNPHYLEAINQGLPAEPDIEAVKPHVDALLAHTGNISEDPALSGMLIQAVLEAHQKNLLVKELMLENGNNQSAFRYLQPRERSSKANPKNSLEVELRQTVQTIAGTMNGNYPPEFNESEVAQIIQASHGILEALQVPHELRDRMRDAVTILTANLATIARYKQYGTQFLAGHQEMDGALAWSADVDAITGSALRTGLHKYAQAMESWAIASLKRDDSFFGWDG